MYESKNAKENEVFQSQYGSIKSMKNESCNALKKTFQSQYGSIKSEI